MYWNERLDSSYFKAIIVYGTPVLRDIALLNRYNICLLARLGIAGAVEVEKLGGLNHTPPAVTCIVRTTSARPAGASAFT